MLLVCRPFARRRATERTAGVEPEIRVGVRELPLPHPTQVDQASRGNLGSILHVDFLLVNAVGKESQREVR